jgi:hypothetical protein
MRSNWWVYTVVAAVAAVAGLAIAGLPDSASTDATIAAPEVTTSVVPDATTTLMSTTTMTATTTTVPPTTQPPATPPPTTVPPTTQPPATPPPTTVPPTAVYVVVANGGDAAGIAGDVVADLGELAYERAFKTDGLDTADRTIVYFEDGYQGEALRLAADVGLAADAIAPLDEAPGVEGAVGAVELLLYLGRDWA